VRAIHGLGVLGVAGAATEHTLADQRRPHLDGGADVGIGNLVDRAHELQDRALEAGVPGVGIARAEDELGGRIGSSELAPE
jgi:hypothetical protein